MEKEVITAEFRLTEEQQEKLIELHQLYINCTFEDGSQPFKNKTIQDTFKLAMEIGSFHTINNHFKAFAWHFRKR